METPETLLKKYWGYDQFRPYQREAVTALTDRRDVLLILPTGGGKSLCYQLPALALPGTAVVISPLLALMKDQVDACRSQGISASLSVQHDHHRRKSPRHAGGSLRQGQSALSVPRTHRR
ncbi:MAG: DEAD/DEAH box helicase [bacterium]|nr:DEAD/DEAH box helicase [bacterium]